MAHKTFHQQNIFVCPAHGPFFSRRGGSIRCNAKNDGKQCGIELTPIPLSAIKHAAVKALYCCPACGCHDAVSTLHDVTPRICKCTAIMNRCFLMTAEGVVHQWFVAERVCKADAAARKCTTSERREEVKKTSESFEVLLFAAGILQEKVGSPGAAPGARSHLPNCDFCNHKTPKGLLPVTCIQCDQARFACYECRKMNGNSPSQCFTVACTDCYHYAALRTVYEHQ